MNAQYNNSTRTFFKDIEGQQVTAAKQIHGQSSSRLSGPAIMRNPIEMPFANDDVVWCVILRPKGVENPGFVLRMFRSIRMPTDLSVVFSPK